MIIKALLLCALIAPAVSLPTGAPCVTQPPHGRQAAGRSPYKVIVGGSCYVAGGSLLVTIRADNGANFQGFVLQAQSATNQGRVGEFTGDNPDWKLNCDTPDSITHTSPSSKRLIRASWTAPGAAVGSVKFVATIAANQSSWWTGLSSSPVPPCGGEQTDSGTEDVPAGAGPEAPLPAPVPAPPPLAPVPAPPPLAPPPPPFPAPVPPASAAKLPSEAAAAAASNTSEGGSGTSGGQNSTTPSSAGGRGPSAGIGSPDQRCQSKSPSEKAAQTGCGGDWVTRYYFNGNHCVFTWLDKSCGEPDNYFVDKLLCLRNCKGEA